MTTKESGDSSRVYAFDDLVNLLSYLRDPQYGCPWDVAQTPETIVPYTIEEVHEVVEAIELKDWDGLGEELGDLLLQIVFYAQMAKEKGHFDLHQVVDRLVKKMVRRHPHVFPSGQLMPPSENVKGDVGVAQVKQTWEAIKRQERTEKKGGRSDGLNDSSDEGPLATSLKSVPKGLDALSSAQKIQVKAARYGLDWPEQVGAPGDAVFLKLQEEVAELSQALAAEPSEKSAIVAELGDVLFTCVNLARHLSIDAAQCLRSATRTFSDRAQTVEALHRAQYPGELMAQTDPERLELLWQSAKHQIKPD